MTRNNRKKTEIPIPEPRHRVGPKGVSSGISFRELPPPSLKEIKKVCEHYQKKCAGDYESLASRYVYQMAKEIENLVDTLERENSYKDKSYLGKSVERRQKVKAKSTAHIQHTDKSCHMKSNEASHAMMKEDKFDFPCDWYEHLLDHQNYSIGSESDVSEKIYIPNQKYSSKSWPYLETEHSKDEMFKWLVDEMQRSHELINRSKEMHDVELDNAKKELKKVKKAAKMIIQAIHKNAKEKAAKLELSAQSERRRRVRSQKIIEDMIKSHADQLEELKRRIHRPTSSMVGQTRKKGHVSDVRDDPTALCGLREKCDIKTVLDELAEEAFNHSYY